MEIRKVVTKYSTNSYLLIKDGGAVIIDPGDDLAFFERILKNERIIPLAVLVTHGHIDHIIACPSFSYGGIKIYISAADKKLIEGGKLSCGIDLPRFKTEEITDGQILDFGFVRLNVMATPGHTEGGVCYISEEQKIIFSGDTLFKSAVGRTDFPSGDEAKLIASLKKLSNLEGDFTIYPGHGKSTTLNAEREFLDEYYFRNEPGDK